MKTTASDHTSNLKLKAFRNWDTVGPNISWRKKSSQARCHLDMGRFHPVLPVRPKKAVNVPGPQRQRHCGDWVHPLILWLPVQCSPQTEGPSGQGLAVEAEGPDCTLLWSLVPFVTGSKLLKPLQASDNQGFFEWKSKKPTWQTKRKKTILEK